MKYPLLATSFFLPLVAFAATVDTTIVDATLLVTRLIVLTIGIGIVLFFWGLIKFVNHAGDEKEHEEGRNLIIWGLIVIFIMVTFYAIVGFFQEQFGLTTNYGVTDLKLPPNTIPTP